MKSYVFFVAGRKEFWVQVPRSPSIHSLPNHFLQGNPNLGLKSKEIYSLPNYLLQEKLNSEFKSQEINLFIAQSFVAGKAEFWVQVTRNLFIYCSNL